MKRFLLVLISLSLFGFMNGNVIASESAVQKESTSVSSESEYKCTVTVYARGSRDTWLYEGATVSGQASGGFTKDVKTDSKGRATLIWHSGSTLKAIYIKGTGLTDTSVKFEGNYEDGGSYTFYIDA